MYTHHETHIKLQAPNTTHPRKQVSLTAPNLYTMMTNLLPKSKYMIRDGESQLNLKSEISTYDFNKCEAPGVPKVRMKVCTELEYRRNCDAWSENSYRAKWHNRR